MRWRDKFPDLKPNQISYDGAGLKFQLPEVTEIYECSRPRLEFIRALKEFDDWEVNNFQHYESGTEVQLDTVIGDSVKIGHNCVIGGSGFGYEPDETGKPIRMPHLANVIIQDGVTIHNNVNIDRGVLSPTIIGEGTCVDSLVHIAHGVIIGENCCLVAQCGIGGSVVIGKNTYIGFGAHIKNKVKIGNNVTIGMGAVVLKDVPDGETWIGNPAKQLIK